MRRTGSSGAGTKTENFVSRIVSKRVRRVRLYVQFAPTRSGHGRVRAVVAIFDMPPTEAGHLRAQYLETRRLNLLNCGCEECLTRYSHEDDTFDPHCIRWYEADNRSGELRQEVLRTGWGTAFYELGGSAPWERRI